MDLLRKSNYTAPARSGDKSGASFYRILVKFSSFSNY